MKTSAVPVENQVIEAPAVVFESQHDVMPAFEAGLLDRDCVVVVRHQGPKANGMPELHKLMPPLWCIIGPVFQNCVSYRWTTLRGASGKVPSAIHVTPEATMAGCWQKCATGHHSCEWTDRRTDAAGRRSGTGCSRTAHS
ncbi:dihydroxy-acid dehydratase [Escherichia coli]